jgi:N-acetylmuramoyl-L-alanine amidase
MTVPVHLMSRHTETKKKVLLAVYEDNAGIPRSFLGKRHPKALPQQQPGHRPGRMLAALIIAIALFGIGLRAILVNETGPGNAPGVAGMGHTAPAPTLPILIGPEPVFAFHGAPADGPKPLQAVVDAVAPTSQYETMLERLGMPMADLFNLSVQTIVIDPGHGGIDPGATGRQGLMEKDVVLDIAMRLRDKLAGSGNYRVLLTREGDRKMFLKERVAFAKENHADLFVSIHINSLPRGSEHVNYVETYFFGPHTDKRSLELAQKENHDSDYSMGDFREVIARIGDTLKTEESQELAGSIHAHLYDNLRRRSPGLMDAKSKAGPFMVLLGVEVPSVLIEVSCISNMAEEKRLNTPGYRDDIADYMEAGIIEYLEQRANRRTIDRGKAEHVAKQES